MDLLLWQTWQDWAENPKPKEWLETHTAALFSQFPELKALAATPQDPTWHPEGNVWVHTMFVCHEAKRLSQQEQLARRPNMVLMLAALCHDIGKPSTTEKIDGRWRALSHCTEGYHVAEKFLERIYCPDEIRHWVLPLVKEHLFHSSLQSLSTKVVRRLLSRLAPASYELLALLVEADQSGRPPLPKGCPKIVKEVFQYLPIPQVKNQTDPLITGHDLIERGLTPGPQFKEVLDFYRQAQENGDIIDREGALAHLDKRHIQTDKK